MGGGYAGRTGFVSAVAIATWLMEESAPQPDTALRIRPEFGQSTVKEKLAANAPEFVAEVCESSRSYDLGAKLKVYERSGVK